VVVVGDFEEGMAPVLILNDMPTSVFFGQKYILFVQFIVSFVYIGIPINQGLEQEARIAAQFGRLFLVGQDLRRPAAMLVLLW